ncbi:MAG: leucine-rich repeat domain-containing protein, partial [Candidatus Ornithomonoglobus sp.]
LETSAFGGCTAIESISIPESLTELKSGTFSRCSSLKNVYIPDSISILGDFVFSSCTSLKHVELPDSVTSIGVGLFADCYAMTDITIPDSVTNISKSALSRISNLQTLTMPGLIELSDAMYEIPSSLTSITVTSDPIEGFAYECDGIRTVNIGPKVKTINPHAFEKCTNLNTVTIENGTTSIARRAFTGCTALKTITIPESVTSIGADAFRDCGKIKDIYYGGSKYDWKHIDTADNNSPLAEAAVHYAKPMPMVYTIDAADISVDKTNNNVTINVSKELDYDGQLITAAYDENGVLINMDCQPLEIETGTSKEITTKPKLENATSIKAWVWEDFNTMLPLSKVSAKETVYQ